MIRKLLYLGIAHLCLAADPEVFENYFDDSVKEVDISLDSAIKGCLQNGNGLADKVKSAYGNCFGKDYDFDDLAKKDGSGDSDNDGLPDTFENNEACFYEKMGWINAAGNLDPDVIKNDLTGLDDDLKAAFDGNIDKCAAWNGNFGSSRKKRGTGETDTDDVAPAIMEKEGSVLGWLKSALRKTRSADPQNGGKGKNSKKKKGRKAGKGKGKKKKNRKNKKGKSKNARKGGKSKGKKGKKGRNRRNRKAKKGGKGKGGKNKNRKAKKGRKGKSKKGGKRRNRKAKKGGKGKGGKNKNRKAKKGRKGKSKKGGKRRNRKAKKGGKGKGKKGGKNRNRKAKKGKKPKGKKGKSRKGKKGKGSKNKKNRARSGKSKGKGKDRNKKTKGKGNKGKDKGKKKGKGKENGRSSSQMAESIYNQLWCFDLSLEQVLEQCVENKIKN